MPEVRKGHSIDGRDAVKPLAIDLFSGLGGWTDGLLAEGWDCVGFDVERHAYGDHRYPAQLVLQDVRTIHGSQFAGASLIVASPPCQEYSYMAMPWSRAKAIAADYRSGVRDRAKLTELFDACFRIQREAIEASTCLACADWHITAYCDACKGSRTRFIPLVVENVRGAVPWVGRSRWNYGSFHLWGDVPALMPITMRAVKVGGLDWKHPSDPRHRPGQAFNPAAQGKALQEERAVKIGGARGDDWFTHHNRPEFEERATKNDGGSWFGVAHNTTSGKGQNPDGRKADGVKVPGGGAGWFGSDNPSPMREHSSKSSARKAASARIAKIPLALARHIARTYLPPS